MSTPAPHLILLAAATLVSTSFANDHFAERTPLDGSLPIAVTSTLDEATSENAEPLHSAERFYPRSRVNSRWWTWRATTNGWYQIDAREAAPTTVAVYTGTRLDQLVRQTASPIGGGNGLGLVQFRTSAGHDYHFALSGQNGAGGDIAFELSAVPDAAINDDFANRIDLGAALDITFVGNNSGATAQPDEPIANNQLPKASIWWQVRPDEDRQYRINFSAQHRSPQATRLNVFEGTELESLRLVAAATPYHNNTVTFAGEAGKAYQIAFDRPTESPLTGPVVLNVRAAADADNDDIADAIDLGSAGTAQLTADLTLATIEPGENSALNTTVWWQWRAPNSERYIINQVADDPDSANAQAAVYSGNAFSGLQLITNLSDRVAAFDAIAGERYFIAIGQRSLTQAGEVAFELRPPEPIENDNFADATLIPNGPSIQIPAHNIGATTEAGEPPNSVSGTLTGTVWWRWQPDSAGIYRIRLADTTFQRSIDIFAGDALATLQSRSPTSSFLEFEALGGETYYLRAQGRNGTADFFTLKINLIPSSTNDNFADAIDLGRVANVRSEASTVGATLEAEEPWSRDDLTVWWRWQAPESGVWELYSFDDANIDVFRGTSLADLEEVHRSEETERTAFVANLDQTYFIRLSVKFGDVETLTIQRGTQATGDSRADAIDLGDTVPVEGRSGLTGATTETGETTINDARSVWWRWRAPESGRFAIWFSSYRNIDVYRGAAADEFANLQSVESGYNDLQQVLFEAIAGEDYLITAVAYEYDEEDWDAGFVEISIDRHIALAGDFYVDAHELGDGEFVEFTAFAGGATYELDDPSHVRADDGGTIWMRWTAPSSGQFHIVAETIFGGDEYRNLGVYVGDTLTDLVTVAEASGDETPARTLFTAQAGTTYHIAFEDEDLYDMLALRLGSASAYDDWAYQRVLFGALPFIDSARNDNPTGDGIPNLMKFALGLDPLLNATHDSNADRLPQLVTTPTTLELHYEIANMENSSAAVSVEHYGEFSTDASTWTRVEPQLQDGRRYVLRVPTDAETRLLRFRVDP